MNSETCRVCGDNETIMFYSPGKIPLVNTLSDSEKKYPLCLYRCPNCGLVFANAPRRPEDIFSNYSYFSSWSATWLEHGRKLYELLVEKFSLTRESAILEIASNDGYLLKNFQQAGYSNVLGVEPAANVAAAAEEAGIPTLNRFFSQALAEELVHTRSFDCIAANNVLAHVPDINDFLKGIAVLLKPRGAAVFEFHHLLSLMTECQFDTVYHEHFSYLSLAAAAFALERGGLRVFDVEKLSTQGGSLRVFVSHNTEEGGDAFPLAGNVEKIIEEEREKGLYRDKVYEDFSRHAGRLTTEAGTALRDLTASGKRIAGYGAAAKGVVFINALGLDKSELLCVADKNPVKQGTLIPGTDIPIVSPEGLADVSPDYVVIFPWNIKDEIISELRHLQKRGTRFIVCMPRMEVI